MTISVIGVYAYICLPVSVYVSAFVFTYMYVCIWLIYASTCKCVFVYECMCTM